MRESRGGGGGGVVGGAWEKLGQSQGPDFSQKKKTLHARDLNESGALSS